MKLKNNSVKVTKFTDEKSMSIREANFPFIKSKKKSKLDKESWIPNNFEVYFDEKTKPEKDFLLTVKGRGAHRSSPEKCQ